MNKSSDGEGNEIHGILKKLCTSIDPEKSAELYQNIMKMIALKPGGILGVSSFDKTYVTSSISDLLKAKNQADENQFRAAMDELSLTEIDQDLNTTILDFMLRLNTQMSYESPVSHMASTSRIMPSISNVSNVFTSLKPRRSQQNAPDVPDERNTTTSSDELEDELIQDAIYAGTGVQGKYLRKNVVTGEFKLDHIKGRTLEVCDAEILLRLAEVGFYHDKVKRYTNPTSEFYPNGCMGQCIVTVLTKEITDYYGLLASLQDDLNEQQRNPGAYRQLTMMHMMVVMMDPLERLQWLSVIAESAREQKGGALASTVYEYIGHGDPIVQEIAKDILRSACITLHDMLAHWMVNGEIVDPNCEFFIEELLDVNRDRLWHEKYRLRASMIPSFISDKLANEILVIGKNINLLREICKVKAPVKERNELKQCLESDTNCLYSVVPNTKLHLLIDKVYLNTSKRVLDIVLGPHRLLDHLEAMRSYLLLGQGNFADVLMKNLNSELDRPAKDLKKHELLAIVAEAVRTAGSSEFEEPEVLNHLEVSFLAPCEGDSGWDVFCLNYKVPGPLYTIFEPTQFTYRTLFKQLWNMKRYDCIITDIWKNQLLLAKSMRCLNVNIKPILQRLQICSSQMFNFVHQMQYYLLFEIIECSWVLFYPCIVQAKTLDEILQSHDKFLESIRVGIFLDESSYIFTSCLGVVFEAARKLNVWFENFERLCSRQLALQKQAELSNDTVQDKAIAWSITSQTDTRQKETKKFLEDLTQCQAQLAKIEFDYDTAVCEFLYQLAISCSESLRQLGMLLDYNEYYKHRDKRLSLPLTFHHMRMTLGNSFQSGVKNCSSLLY